MFDDEPWCFADVWEYGTLVYGTFLVIISFIGDGDDWHVFVANCMPLMERVGV